MADFPGTSSDLCESFDEFLERQRDRITVKLTKAATRHSKRRRTRNAPVIAELDYVLRGGSLSVDGMGAMGSRKPTLSQLDGERQ